LVTRGGTFQTRYEFCEHVVNRALAQLPTPEQIESGLYATYRNAMVATGADVESEWAREAKLASQREIEWQKARTVEEEERAKRRQIEIELADAEHQAEVQRRERERRMRLMRQAELEHAKEQLAETVNPFQEVRRDRRCRARGRARGIARSVTEADGRRKADIRCRCRRGRAQGRRDADARGRGRGCQTRRGAYESWSTGVVVVRTGVGLCTKPPRSSL